jgi:cupin 2 domain-containing protein
MDAIKGNIYDKASMPADGSELSELLLQHTNFRIERIISNGQTTPEGSWYDQSNDEWVILLQGEARLEFSASGIVNLSPGDYLWIPAHTLHKVIHTSLNPECIWLALHST